MHLFHYQRRDGVENFGDRLNLWLWPKLLPAVFDGAGTPFVGIGTVLNQRLPERLPQVPQAVIFSTGAGYEQPLQRLPQGWQVYCVRGPLSARQLRLPESLAITDGALLLRRFFRGTTTPQVPFAFMPHIHHATYAGETWQHLCQHLGFGYIDPRWPVEQVLTALGTTEVVLAEAMHGAIAADALGIPWIPVQTSARILSFKWYDWCASVQLPFRPVRLPPLSEYPPVAQGLRSAVKASRYWLYYYQQTPDRWVKREGSKEHEEMSQRLLQVAQTTAPWLTQDGHRADLENRLEVALDQFKADFNKGLFNGRNC